MADAGPDADVGSGAGSGVRLPHFLEDTWTKLSLIYRSHTKIKCLHKL